MRTAPLVALADAGRPTAVVRLASALSLGLLTGACMLPFQSNPTAQIAGYSVVRDIQLPGDTSRWDYQVFDPITHRLYLAHLGASQIVVFDSRASRVIATVDGIEDVHGLVLAPDLHRLFASATGKNQIAAIDTETLKVIGRSEAGDYPDGLAYAAVAGKLYISDEHGSGDTIIDARSVRKLGQIRLGGSIGNTRFDPGTKLVYVAVGSDSTVVAIEPASDRIAARYPLKGCENAHGLEPDRPEQHRLFVACDKNAVLVTLDLATGVSGVPIKVGDGPDVLALDPELRRLYVASESGRLTVFDVSRGEPVRLAEGNAGPNAHTVAVDPGTHHVFLALTDVGGHPVLREMAPA